MAERQSDTLSTLQNVLASAARLAQDIAADPLVPRLLDIVRRMPIEDREIVLNVLEREVDLRNLSKQAPSGSLSGLNVPKPNPKEPAPYIAPEEIVQAVIRAARVLRRASDRGSDLASVWEPAMVQGLRQID